MDLKAVPAVRAGSVLEPRQDPFDPLGVPLLRGVPPLLLGESLHLRRVHELLRLHHLEQNLGSAHLLRMRDLRHWSDMLVGVVN